MTDAPAAIQLILPAADAAIAAAAAEPESSLLDTVEPGERETLVDLGEVNLLWGLVLKSKNMVLSIIGDDDRRPIHDGSIAPWNGLSLVRVTDKSGAVRTGTAFLINRDWALTAAHVIWNAPLGENGLPYRIDISLGLNGGEAALTTTADYSIDPAYAGGAEAVHDVALIRLTNPAPEDAYIYKVEAPSDAVLNRKDGAGFNIFGYPEDKPNRIWGATGFLSGVYAQSLTYKIDTCPGQSGAPIIYRTKTDRYVIGVHTNGVGGASCKVDASKFNEGARVTSAFKRWVQNTQSVFAK